MEQPICQNDKEAWRLPDQITLATSHTVLGAIHNLGGARTNRDNPKCG